MFDTDHYTAQVNSLPDGLSPEAHYDRVGWRLGLDPSPDFSTRYYLAAYPDVRRHGTNPLEHFLLFGREEGRAAQPPGVESLEEMRALAEPVFDAEHYTSRYGAEMLYPDDPLRDFLTLGRETGRWPNADFSPTDYLFSNPDLLEHTIANGFDHYIRHGRAEGRPVRTRLLRQMRDRARAVGPYFFERFYLQQLDPALLVFRADWFEHYLAFGWKQSFDPSPLFSVETYLKTAPQLAGGETDPYTHFLTKGRDAGLRAQPSREPLA